MDEALQLLKKYWNYDDFRDIQSDIIASVLSKNDVFAQLPTGGGKSVCYQIPALLNDGIAIVISPLVSLIKDQVENLQKKGIKAIGLVGGISTDEISDLLDNCQYGNYKLLYLSPERLQSDWILDRLKNLTISLIAIDEAHCISQWGNDFRPAYLKIANLKSHFPKTPLLALTASATPRVKQDILEVLKIQNASIFEKSFNRDNIAYMVFDVEDKLFRMVQILKKNPEPSIIYVRNRKACLEIARQLEQSGISSTYYHGGLTTKEKNDKMFLWTSERVQVIVATNAFGMGIDKGNVKTVIHIQLPDSMESYYQEAGRCGRNGQKAYAVLLHSPSDYIQAEAQFLAVLPDKEFLNVVFKKLNSYFRIGYGEGINESFSFNLNEFCSQYQLPILKTFNAIQFLDRQGVLTLSAEFSQKITAQFIIPSKEVIRYLSLNSSHEETITTILRTYPGIYEVPANLNTNLIAKKAHTTPDAVVQILENLHRKEIISYKAHNNDSTIVFNEIREDEKTINRVSKFLVTHNELKKQQLHSVMEYVSNKNTCKAKLILNYFGETKKENCGICSYCISLKKTSPALSSTTELIISALEKNSMDSRSLEKITRQTSNQVIFALQELLEQNKIEVLSNNHYRLKK
ncbi:ATP-dependent DNA helicase RecQ [Flavobacterium sp.]|uniref:RecQ family ATP-dependent DNA helicase n=1 Tax=Flavobacterium sp. TaxID=239 RepID=UPI0026219FDE|nr:ATP-dependent DNA helicase RecQ [Flavobacterium sp.]MDD3004055.1 RecQ family ATP-dependent DNA helicase [Flavobacterium sp.]